MQKNQFAKGFIIVKFELKIGMFSINPVYAFRNISKRQHFDIRQNGQILRCNHLTWNLMCVEMSEKA